MHIGMESRSKWLEADYCFCHPYSSWERGLNENTNGLIRCYVPKGSSFRDIGTERIRWIARKLNTRPGKSLGYLTPEEVLRYGVEKNLRLIIPRREGDGSNVRISSGDSLAHVLWD